MHLYFWEDGGTWGWGNEEEKDSWLAAEWGKTNSCQTKSGQVENLPALFFTGLSSIRDGWQRPRGGVRSKG